MWIPPIQVWLNAENIAPHMRCTQVHASAEIVVGHLLKLKQTECCDFSRRQFLRGRAITMTAAHRGGIMLQMTSAPQSVAQSAAAIKPEWLRLPAPRGRCPFTGLSRSTLNELTIPGSANGGNPPVKSVVLRKRGALRGIRLISYDSLMSYLATLGAPRDSRSRELGELLASEIGGHVSLVGTARRVGQR
jgi:hypothetical protein